MTDLSRFYKESVEHDMCENSKFLDFTYRYSILALLSYDTMKKRFLIYDFELNQNHHLDIYNLSSDVHIPLSEHDRTWQTNSYFYVLRCNNLNPL